MSNREKFEPEFNKKEGDMEKMGEDEILRVYVNEVYEKSGANREIIESFKEHNNTVSEYAKDLAGKEKISFEDLDILVTAAIFHDASKLGTEEGKSVPLVKHGWESAKMAENKLRELGEREEFIKSVKNAIERHMGPIPGFMQKQAEKWEKETGEKIEFPRPQNIIDKILYDADMLALIDIRGIEKIMNIRKATEVFIREDQETAAKEGIAQEEAALKSALKSGKEAAESLFTDFAKEKARELLRESETQIRRKIETN